MTSDIDAVDGEITVLFTDLKGSTTLYERIGDLNAYVQVQSGISRSSLKLPYDIRER